jgi:alcohol dehydrogenase class IV
MINSFSFSTTPHLYFGTGKISILPSVITSFASKVLVVTGAESFVSSPQGLKLREQLELQGIDAEYHIIDKEPTPAMIDAAVTKFHSLGPEVVVAVGGGSVLDAGKAISAMIPLNEPVKDYLEGVGSKASHPGIKIPFIAIPTTSGTGSEATKNAVLSETGENGYKRSLRHDNFVPDVAIIDPELTLNCPAETTAASGMDAFTQLLESYLSLSANPVTDALCLQGLDLVSRSLMAAYKNGADIDARTDMALASYLSGITLANAGLGLVHGFASSIGGYFEIRHGVICSSLMPAVNQLTVQKLRSKQSNEQALKKYAVVGKMFSSGENRSQDDYIDHLLLTLHNWANEMKIPKLRQGGVSTADFQKIVAATGNKNNPVALDQEEMNKVLEMAF